ncbi:dihydrofolate reductase [Cytobacillus solani]|uniref:Dihydrofolate reductase n=1 Tax=Cytobacillus solani TaxID=1637975 RepID=A0A0Q3QRC5_9BACI|nr:dihydrofolate reductase [Cytobacillus solani]KOP83126.1 dihydrofolate reductase [Bacillus sp. FJAT-21945]KQL20152.1 dihydrofolate reductase [Cytobacillus solani]USK53402.1 dihydrofolate reductase [Cytobacillus solani]
MISLMWAMDNNHVIGYNNQLPWHLPEDLKFFKRTTMGHPIAMGRKTWDSIGRPLPGRENIVITRNPEFTCEGCTVLNSVEALLEYSRQKEEEIFVIGGAEIFKLILPDADKLYLTRIYDEFKGDTFFPALNLEEWSLLSREKGIKDEKNPYDYEFMIYEKK